MLPLFAIKAAASKCWLAWGSGNLRKAIVYFWYCCLGTDTQYISRWLYTDRVMLDGGHGMYEDVYVISM